MDSQKGTEHHFLHQYIFKEHILFFSLFLALGKVDLKYL